MHDLSIPVKEYEKLASQFDPYHFDADTLVRFAKSWGMKYLVFTAKHHDGFALYHSKVDAYNCYDASPCKRDLVKELQVACEKYDLKFCIYYSQAQDWHEKNAFYAGRETSTSDFNTYLEKKCIPQLQELLTEYGKISAIWFDTPQEMTTEQSNTLLHLVKELQPDCLVSGRIGNNKGDYYSFGDNALPIGPIQGDWEVPATLNDTWGFNKDDHNWKDSQEILTNLLKINSRGGNYLLNIGPDATGEVPKGCLDILKTVGSYVHQNEEAIFATRAVFGNSYELSFGEMTAKDYRVFLHVIHKPLQYIWLRNLLGHIESVSIIGSSEKVRFSKIDTHEMTRLTIDIPKSYHNKINYCIKICLKEKDIQFMPIQVN